jgi:hypothetical protein
MPHRIQRKRTKGWKMPPNTVSVTRPGPWGNPRRVGMYQGYSRADAVADFHRWLNREIGTESWCAVYGKPPTLEKIKAELRGRNLACFCPLNQPCHADILLALANS